MKYIAIIIILFLFVGSLAAQVVSPDQESNVIDRSIYGLGLSAGVASGFGLSFRHHLPGDVSYQLVGGVIKADRVVSYNIGGEFQYDFIRSESTRFFGASALGVFYNGKSGHNDLRGPVRFGLGVGGEYSKGSPLHVSAELLFTYFSNGDVLPLPQLALHYYFF
jgi:hypothetical protein